MKDTSEERKVGKAIMEAFNKRKFDDRRFYLQLEKKLRKHRGSYNSRVLKQLAVVKMASTDPTTMERSQHIQRKG